MSKAWEEKVMDNTCRTQNGRTGYEFAGRLQPKSLEKQGICNWSFHQNSESIIPIGNKSSLTNPFNRVIVAAKLRGQHNLQVFQEWMAPKQIMVGRNKHHITILIYIVFYHTVWDKHIIYIDYFYNIHI